MLLQVSHSTPELDFVVWLLVDMPPAWFVTCTAETKVSGQRQYANISCVHPYA